MSQAMKQFLIYLLSRPRAAVRFGYASALAPYWKEFGELSPYEVFVEGKFTNVRPTWRYLPTASPRTKSFLVLLDCCPFFNF